MFGEQETKVFLREPVTVRLGVAQDKFSTVLKTNPCSAYGAKTRPNRNASDSIVLLALFEGHFGMESMRAPPMLPALSFRFPLPKPKRLPG
jgi:hypothetical protein